MKKIIVAFLSLILLISCSSSDSSAVSSAILVKKSIHTNEDGTIETSLTTYNGNKIVKLSNDTGFNFEFTYTGELITIMKIFQGSTLFGTTTYSYNSLGELSEYVQLILPYNLGTQIIYTHNADGSIDFTRTTGDLVSQTQNPINGKLVFSNGEIIRQETYETGATSVVNYTYDNKMNPAQNITGFTKIAFTQEFMNGFTHNILSEQHVNNSSNNVSHVYQYNANDYPTLDTQTSSTGVSTTAFYYE